MLRINQLTGFGSGVGVSAIDHPITGVFCCGFECESEFTGSGGIRGHWTYSVGPSFCSYSTSTVRGASLRSLRVNPNGSAMVWAEVNLPTPVTVSCTRVYVRFATLPTTDCYLMWTGASSGRSGIMFHQASSTLRAASGVNPVSAGSGVSVTTGVWYRLDMHSVQNSGTNARIIDGQVDGTALTQIIFTSFNAPSTYKIGVQGAAAPTADIFFDDFVQSDTTADYPIGAGYVLPFVPVADGAHNITAGNFKVGSTATDITNATNNSWQLVDDFPLDIGTPTTDDYIAQVNNATTEYVEHIFGPAPGVSMPSLPPRTVELIIGSHDAVFSGTNNMTSKLNDNGTESAGLVMTLNSDSVINFANKHFALAPTGGAWTNTAGAGNFTNLKHRCGYSSDAAPDAYFDCVMVEAEFEE